MKKLLRIAVVLGLVLCLSVSAVAGNNSIGRVVGGAVDSNGQKVEVTETDSTVTLTPQEAADIIDAVDHLNLGADDVTVLPIKDLTAEIPAGGSITITFDVSLASDEQPVYVFHHDGSSWGLVGEGKGKTVTVTFTSLSPVALVLGKEAGGTQPNPSEPGNGEPTSPKTGEEPVLLVAGAIALFAGAVAVVVLKKKKEM